MPRLYAILDFDLCAARGLQPVHVLAAWLAAGIRLVQLRAKSLSLGPFLQLADECAARCGAVDATFIVNDRPDVACLAGADGVHLGQGDLSPAEARRVLPAPAWIGLSTHSDAQLAAGLESVATYLAIGPVFETVTKTNPDACVGLAGVRRAADLVRAATTPLVAIGGIDLANASSVLAAGANAVAVISSLLDGPDLASRARAFLHAVDSP